MNEFEIAAKFKINAQPTGINSINCGNINRTYKITVADGNSYVLQRINTAVFKNPHELMNNVCGICEHIRGKLGKDTSLKETLTFIETETGSYLLEDGDGGFWRMYKFIEAVSYQTIENPQLFFEAAKAFGQFQLMLADYPIETLAETIPNFHNTAKRFADFRLAVENCTIPERLREAEYEIRELLSREKLSRIAVDALAAGEIPLRVTHNDTKLNNILMDASNNEGICVIDLDTVMPGSILYDFGDAIRFGASTAVEDEPDLSKISLDLELFERFLSGFIYGMKGSLTERELELLPEGAMLITYEQAMRFLGDYLNGDTYYKIKYDKHNLVRARAQLALLLDMESKLAEMRSLIKVNKVAE